MDADRNGFLALGNVWILARDVIELREVPREQTRGGEHPTKLEIKLDRHGFISVHTVTNPRLIELVLAYFSQFDLLTRKESVGT